MRQTKIINVVGARPNFMKIAPIVEAVKSFNERYKSKFQHSIESILVHTGQHYDDKMSKSFFDDLAIPRPDIDLEVGSGTHAEQTAEIMKRFEPVLRKENPDYIVVVGDVNSTIACALTASKLGVKIIHVEAGLRSFDRTMPEEINRVLTDAISDLLFVTERSAEENLLREGIAKEKIYFVGNVMIDTLLKHREKAKKSPILKELGLLNNSGTDKSDSVAPYAVLTLHRPSNVDDADTMHDILEAVEEISRDLPVIFPIHPRTRKNLLEFGLEGAFTFSSKGDHPAKGIVVIEPVGYLDFLNLTTHSRLVLSDSGGIQEETTVLGIPCITLRENTERPATVTEGSNHIAGTSRERIVRASIRALNSSDRAGRIPELWDGKAAERIVQIIAEDFSSQKGN
jgi:UDP-N-acetylglucosamine 2-epimerase (non-hydrolysing)